MAKPGGSRCNMACGYCYYLGRGASGPAPGPALPPPVLPDHLLESFIAQRIAASPGPVTHFEWHGGEPTLLGLDWFRRMVRVQKRHCPPGRRITNGLQTNGLLIDEAWARFLAREGFSVGLSLDGNAEMHDLYRKRPDGAPTQARVLRSFEILAKEGVFTNILCVLHRGNAGRPDEVYGFFREIGATWLQFLPLVTPSTGSSPHPAAAPVGLIGDFLCRVFDLWLEKDVGRVVVQAFDEALRPIYGAPHALCVHRESCGDVAVLERDGGFYVCDHFVDPGHLVGTLASSPLAELAASGQMRRFGAAKKEELAPFCRACVHLPSCNGGCPKDRFLPAPDGSGLVSWLCPAYQQFFGHCRPGLARLAAHMKKGLPLRAFVPSAR